MTIQETNIERILHDTLWKEVDLLDVEIQKAYDLITQLQERKRKLEAIAKAGEITRNTEAA